MLHFDKRASREVLATASCVHTYPTYGTPGAPCESRPSELLRQRVVSFHILPWRLQAAFRRTDPLEASRRNEPVVRKAPQSDVGQFLHPCRKYSLTVQCDAGALFASRGWKGGPEPRQSDSHSSSALCQGGPCICAYWLCIPRCGWCGRCPQRRPKSPLHLCLTEHVLQVLAPTGTVRDLSAQRQDANVSVCCSSKQVRTSSSQVLSWTCGRVRPRTSMSLTRQHWRARAYVRRLPTAKWRRGRKRAKLRPSRGKQSVTWAHNITGVLKLGWQSRPPFARLLRRQVYTHKAKNASYLQREGRCDGRTRAGPGPKSRGCSVRQPSQILRRPLSFLLWLGHLRSGHAASEWGRSRESP